MKPRPKQAPSKSKTDWSNVADWYDNLVGTEGDGFKIAMSILNNGKFLSRAVDLCDARAASSAFRNLVAREEIRRGSRIVPKDLAAD